MLRNLVINNIALIGHLELEFSDGLTVMTGETGSGKSIIVDALAFVLGERADKTLIKYGEDYADVSAVFDIEGDETALSRLSEYGYGDENEIIISRAMSVSGKNDIRIQGRPTTLSVLKEVSAVLVDIFGQSQHLNLLRENSQLDTLDAFCDFKETKNELSEKLYPKLRELNGQLLSFGGSQAERERLADILKFQIDEISNAKLSEQEESELDKKHKRIVNMEKIAAALSEAVGCLSGDSGSVSSLSLASDALRTLSSFDGEALELCERLDSVRIETDDICRTVESMLENTDYDSKETDRIEERIEKIKSVKRKYGGTVADTLAFLDSAKEKYEKLANASEIIDKLHAQKERLLSEMYSCANKISFERKRVAEKFCADVKNELSDLGMGGTSFSVIFSSAPNFYEYCSNPSKNGYDKVEFQMSANIGEPLKPLSKVISGGEMSRFMLAIKNITAQAEKIPTMVFDEIDTGISGSMAKMVAMKLAKVSGKGNSNKYQCIVITHLPQIAAMADENLLINKLERSGRTYTEVARLSTDEDKAKEISRLMGGIGEHSLLNAKELVIWSENYKKNIG